MDERVGFTRAVKFGAAGFAEAQVGIEGAGLGVGFVDFEGDLEARREGLAGEGAGDALTKRTGVDEEGVQLVSCGAEEGDGLVVFIDSDQEAGVGEVLVADEAGEEFEVGGGKKMMGGLDGGEPDGVETFCVGGG